jgi:hypothetical protein
MMAGAPALASLMGPAGGHMLGSLLGPGAMHAMANAYRELPAIHAQNTALGMALGLGAIDPYTGYRGNIAPAFLQGYW